MSTKTSYFYDRENDLHVYRDFAVKNNAVLLVEYKGELLDLPKPLIDLLTQLAEYRRCSNAQELYNIKLKKLEGFIKK